MRLLIVGRLNGQITTAVKMAMSSGAKVAHVETCSAATHALRAGQGADLLMVKPALSYLDVERVVQAAVQARTGILLEPEVRILGESA